MYFIVVLLLGRLSSLSPNRRTGQREADITRRIWRVAALGLLLAPAGAHAQALKTVQLAGGTTTLEGGRELRVTGGYVDPRTGSGRVEHRGGRVVRIARRYVRRVRTSGLLTRVVTRSGARLRLNLAQLLFAGGSTTLTLDPGLGLGERSATFRIVGGRLDARTMTGEIGHRGSMDLDRLHFRDIAVQPGIGVSAVVGDFRPVIGRLRGMRPDVQGLRATFPPVPATLTAIAADRLNTRFETDRYREGMPLGTVTVRGRLRG